MRLAIIGFGEVGRCYARALHDAGFELLLCEQRPSASALDISAEWALPLHSAPGAWLCDADWVISCVTGAHALPVLEQCAQHLKPGAGFADFTTASPEVKRRAARAASAAGLRYVDTAIMGAITLNWVRTPLLAAGDGATDLKDIVDKAGGRVQVIKGGSAGDAISLKVLRSVFTKGMEALTVELLTSAEKQGVREELYQQLDDIDHTPLRDFLEMLVRTHVVHAKRRAHEVHDAQQELAAQGLISVVLPGVEEKFLDTAQKLEQGGLDNPHPSIEQALAWLLAHTSSPSTNLNRVHL